MNTQLFIPKKIKVGFNLREDCYTKKLGYIIAHDGKVWRKETSWENWRQKKGQKISVGGRYENGKYVCDTVELGDEVNPQEFNNEPTSGFVLNKKAGGYKTGWDVRRTVCRVFDPRGFEFEISIPNLLYALENCNCLKGKGLEGNFVYSWDGKELVLLPCVCEEYDKAESYTKLQGQKVGAKTLVPGCNYKSKRDGIYIYVGRYDWYQVDWYKHRSRQGKKYHIFTKDGKEFETKSGLDFLAEKITDEPVANFAEIIENFQKNPHSSKIIKWEIEPVVLDVTTHKRYENGPDELKRTVYYRVDEKGHLAQYTMHRNSRYNSTTKENDVIGYYYSIEYKFDIESQTPVKHEEGHRRYGYYYGASGRDNYSPDEINKLNLGDLYITFENGKRVKYKDGMYSL